MFSRSSACVQEIGTCLLLLIAFDTLPADDQPLRIDQRVPWTTSKIVGTPDPSAPYRVVPAFPKLTFTEPLELVTAPGTDRLFVAERFGQIKSFVNRRDTAESTLLLDLQKTVYGLTFHPHFASNGYFFVTYILDPAQEEPLGTRVSRFQVSRDNPLVADPNSELVVFEWRSGGHNGGCLAFGPDGYLYIATGDSSGIADEYLTGQDLSNPSGAILRIDVDQATAGSTYAVPADNPFVGTEGARPEIWAYGLRQPWKMSFDRTTGDLWTGNVGQDLWEQVLLITRGGNYGWSVMEGSHPFRPERPRGPTPFIPPVAEHDHAEFRSITGGFVYHGSRLPELRGAYIYGDYDTGKIWLLRYDRADAKVTEQRELVDSTLRLVGFAEDQAGELYLLDHMRGAIFELQANPVTGQVADFPRQLSGTGLFASVKDHRVAAGVIPYDVNAPQWVDGATKQRYLALPGTSQIEFDGITYPQPAPDAPHGWKFPDGTVLFETLSLEIEPGQPRRIETRVLHYEKLEGSEEVGDQFWRTYTYVWNDEQTDATLLEDPRGADRTFSIADPAAPGGQRQQTWHFPSRAECTVCHNMAAKYALGGNTLQLNRDFDYGERVDNQLRTFEHLGLFTQPLPQSPDELPRLANYHDSKLPIDARARAYLHANCSHCHRKWGGGNTEFRLLSTVALNEMGIANVPPAHGGFYISNARILTPGSPYTSVLYYRVAKLGPGRMPRIGSTVVDAEGVTLLGEWIRSLNADRAQIEPVEATALQLLVGADAAERTNAIVASLARPSSAMMLARGIDRKLLAPALRDEVLKLATAHPDAHIRDLFERYLPEEQRTKRLGSVILPEAILALTGDAERGRAVFFETSGVQCKSCHKINNIGADVGPDLTQIGKKYDRAKILENILDPSKEIDPKFRTYLIETTNGQVHTGVLVKNEPPEVLLKDAKNNLIRLASAEVEELIPQQQSLMPDLLLRDLTAEQVADLITFLTSLKGG